VLEKNNYHRGSLPWFALRLRSNFEKTTAQLLEYRGYEVFLPTYRTRRRWSDRVKEIEAPFFTGYLFCRIDMSHRLPVLTTPGVVGIAGRGKIPEPVGDHEIAAVRTIVESGLFSQPWPFLTAGDRIRVEYGPLAGTEGILTCVKGNYRLVASVSLLQRSVAVELDRDWVQPIDRPVRQKPALALAELR
jgi:transcription antitermination factor NusG